MQSPLNGYDLLTVDSALSTQDLAARELGDAASRIGAVITPEQLSGRGRFNREWLTPRGEALTVSLILRAQADHPAPHLLGMACAIAAAGAIHARLQWPNDLVIEGKKVGGILTEMYRDASARQVAIVGMGINLNQAEFPESIKDRAVSLFQVTGQRVDPEAVLKSILGRLELLPEPKSWADLAPVWEVFDKTPGKRYKMPDGKEVIAIGIGGLGELIATDEGTPLTVMAADAVFGRTEP